MFRVGQLVVCVDDSLLGDCLTTKVVRGAVYTIRAFETHHGIAGVLLCEIVNLKSPYGGEYGYLARRFRPIVDSRLDVFREMLVRPPTERVDA